MANRTLVTVVADRAVAASDTVVPRGLGRRVLEETLVAVTERLMGAGVAWVRRPKGLGPTPSLAYSSDIARGLGAHKLVVVDVRGGLRTAAGPRSFLNSAAAQRLAGGRGLQGWRGRDLEVMIAALRDGVESINLTTACGLHDELFSYEGAGTLLTQADYCRIARLRVDDFAQALAMLDRGEKEGFLLPRDQGERARLLLGGYGAWFEGRLAGIASLDVGSYAREGMAEIVGLYTITRFKGEGVGVRILEVLTAVARRRGCRAVFACTSDGRAADFFVRNGFDRREPSAVPARKWTRRGRRRGTLPAVLVKKLAPGRAREPIGRR